VSFTLTMFDTAPSTRRVVRNAEPTIATDHRPARREPITPSSSTRSLSRFIAGVLAGTLWWCASDLTLAQEYYFKNFAGRPVGGIGTDDGCGPDARLGFSDPGVARPYGNGLALDPTGNLIVADTSNQIIRRMTPNGCVATLAGTPGVAGWKDGSGGAAQFNWPNAAAVDPRGNIYVSDFYGQTIRKLSPAGDVKTLAGMPGESGYADGSGQIARFAFPSGLAFDLVGDLLVADSGNGLIRRITSAGEVSTFETSGSPLLGITGLAVDAKGNIYATSVGNVAVYKVTPTGTATVFAGSPSEPGSQDGPGSTARFGELYGIAIDAAGNLYVPDIGNGTLRRITPEGLVTTLAGHPGYPMPEDGLGSVASLGRPYGVVATANGNIYLADQNLIREVTPEGFVWTLAGSTGTPGTRDGAGSEAQFEFPRGMALDAAGNLYVADVTTIRRITPAGLVTTIAGAPGQAGSVDGFASDARFKNAISLALDANGTIYLADVSDCTIREVNPGGWVTTLAGRSGVRVGSDGIGTAATFSAPHALALAPDGVLYVLDDCHIRRVTPKGEVSTLAHPPGVCYDLIAADPAETVFLSDGSGLWRLTSAGISVGVPIQTDGADDFFATAMATDPFGNIYFADGNAIRKISPSGKVSTLGGTPSAAGYRDGMGSAARFFFPGGIAVDSHGIIYVADTGNGRISRGIPAYPIHIELLAGKSVLATVPGAPAGLMISIESSTNLRDWTAFPSTTFTNGSYSVQRPISSGPPVQFFRARFE
jgi:sugar lactone lactonase YvrE